jgi:predicted amidohydrolase YtcJ
LPAPRPDEIKQALRRGIEECLALGITTFHDAGCGRREVAAYRELLAADEMPLRIYVMLWGADESLLAEHFRRGPEIGLGDGRLTIRSIKLMADGALGSRGAALLEPYHDEPKSTGLLILSEDQVFRIAGQALRHGFQVCTHAIGDRTNRVVLDAYERALAAHREVKDPRFRVEHAQLLDERDIPRFARLGVIASMQATHCTSDMPWVPDRIGLARAEEGAYVWQKLLRSGARIANGSDAPVESLNPLWGFFAAVTRHDHQGKPPGGWFPDQRMTREEALRSFTLEGAYAAFEEADKGWLAKGKLADLVVLSHDILTIPTPKVLATDVVMTIVGGKVAYVRPEAK